MKRLIRAGLIVTTCIICVMGIAYGGTESKEKMIGSSVVNIIPVEDRQNLEESGIHNLVIYQTGNKLDILNGREISDEIEIAFKCTDEKYDNLNGHPADGLGYTEDFDDTTYRKPVLGYSLTSKRDTVVEIAGGSTINIETKVRKIGNKEEVVFNIPLLIKEDTIIK